MRKRIYSILFCILLVVSTLFQKEYEPTGAGGSLFQEQVSLNLWYTDEALTDYLNSVCLYYQEETGVRVVPKLVSGLEYLDALSESSFKEGDLADVFIASNDALGRTYFSGLSLPVEAQNTSRYPKAAALAVSYQGKQIAYPLYYETAFLLCNETYLDQMAQSAIQAEADALEGEEAMAMTEGASDEDMEAMALQGVSENATEISEAEVEQKKTEMIPATVEDLLTIADTYDAPEAVEAILSWDVTDILYNYFFVGSFLNLGGEYGDDDSQIQIYSDKAAEALTVYQSLNQFFSIEAQKVSYESVLAEFMEGKTIFTIATTDAISKLEQAKADGSFPYEYKVASLPSTGEGEQARSMSVTYAAVVNGFGEHQVEANEFARSLSEGLSEDFYEKTGKLPAVSGLTYTNEQIDAVVAEYEDSMPVPKMLELSNFWVMLEAAFTDIWNGADVETTLRNLDQSVRVQLGEIVPEDSEEDSADVESVESEAEMEIPALSENAVSENVVSENIVE